MDKKSKKELDELKDKKCSIPQERCNNLIMYQVGDVTVKHPMAGFMEEHFGKYGLDKIFWNVEGHNIPISEILLNMRLEIERDAAEQNWVTSFREIVEAAPSEQMLQLQINQLQDKLGNKNG